MKYNSLITGFFFTLIMYQSSIYDIQLQAANGAPVNMTTFANKKILITVFDAANPDRKQLRFLDSLRKADTAINIIAVPSNEFGSGTETNSAIISLTKSLKPGFLVTAITKVKKSSGNNQHPLFKWLTDVKENGHFNTEVETPGQLFLISKTGVLYGVLDMKVPESILQQALNQNIE